MLDLNKTIVLDCDESESMPEHTSVIAENPNVPEITKGPVDDFTHDIEEKLLNGNYKNLEACHEAYNQYAFATGFSIHKGKQYYSIGTCDPKIKWYVCSLEGVKNEKYNVDATFNKFSTRTECQAKISFQKEKGGLWKVTNFIKEHNHVLALSDERRYLRSARRVTKSTGDMLESMVNSGIKPVDGISSLL